MVPSSWAGTGAANRRTLQAQVLSDLHFECGTPFDVPAAQADILILAGDIHEGLRGVEWAIAQARRLEIPVLYVFGNHEFYGQCFPSLFTEARLRCHGSGVHILERDTFTFGDVRFLGCTLWSDFQLYGAGHADFCREYARVHMPDYEAILTRDGRPLQPEDTTWVFQQSLQWLEQQLKSPWKGRTVVITHHAPIYYASEPENDNSPLAAAMISNHPSLLQNTCVDTWIHGHTHHNINARILNTHVISHQQGYPHEEVCGEPFAPEHTFAL